MRWGVFLVAALLALACDTSLLSLFSIGTVVPMATPTLAVFVALSAPRMTALWAALWLGLLLDLASPMADGEGRAVFIAGPHALGFVFAANLVIPLRSMVIRRNPFTLGVLAALFAVAASLVVVAISVARSWYPGALSPFGPGGASGELWRSAVAALYTGAFGVPLGWLLARSTPIWGFQTPGPRARR